MRLLKRSQRRTPKVSFVLLDWSVRESFHFLHYLSRQTVPRDDFEVLVIEYYSRESAALRRHLSQVDTWAILGMPPTSCYHKHLMYNAGIVLARGEILVFCDSDAMARETLVGEILEAFDRNHDIVLHLDQFRNMRRDFYPFNFPSFDDVIGPGCINNSGGRTKGVAEPNDPLHDRNYGACMCARRQDLIAIGGADEHLDYLGHICGPYEMTFRLVNIGRREIWHTAEFLYHTWHPGQAGVGDYLGPHDGRHMSTTALEALATRRVKPYIQNPAVQLLRENPHPALWNPEQHIIAPDRVAAWTIAGQSRPQIARSAAESRTIFDYRGFRVERRGTRYSAHPIIDESGSTTDYSLELDGATVEEIQAGIDRAIRGVPRVASAVGSIYMTAVRATVATGIMMRRFGIRVASVPGRLLNAARTLAWRTVDRIRRFRLEQLRTSGSLTSLIVNLHTLGQRPEIAPGGQRPVLVTDARAVAYYLRALALIGSLPRLDVVLVRSQDVGRWSAAVSQRGETPRYIVGREFYNKHRSVLAATGLARRMTVL